MSPSTGISTRSPFAPAVAAVRDPGNTCPESGPLPEALATGAPASSRAWATAWPHIRAHIAGRSRILLALGFDGILAPIVGRPAEAAIPESVMTPLAKLAASSRVSLVLLSGRSMGDLQERVGLPGVYYVGNHGTEVKGPGLVSSDGLASSCRSDLVDALAFLARCTKRLPGVFVEDKGMTVSVHWRRAESQDVHSLREWMELFVGTHPRLSIVEGPASWDLRARASWDKADALRQILLRCKMDLTDLIFVGQESNDREAFARLGGAQTFSVGESASPVARYALSDDREVSKLLFCILCAVSGVHLK